MVRDLGPEFDDLNGFDLADELLFEIQLLCSDDKNRMISQLKHAMENTRILKDERFRMF